jgi:hypothetical protein
VDVFKVPEEMSEKLVTPGTTGLAAGDGLGFVTLRAERLVVALHRLSRELTGDQL